MNKKIKFLVIWLCITIIVVFGYYFYYYNYKIPAMISSVEGRLSLMSNKSAWNRGKAIYNVTQLKDSRVVGMLIFGLYDSDDTVVEFTLDEIKKYKSPLLIPFILEWLGTNEKSNFLFEYKAIDALFASGASPNNDKVNIAISRILKKHSKDKLLIDDLFKLFKQYNIDINRSNKM